jgi:hypothetical protein
MTRTLSARFALGLLFALGIAATAGAQTPDSRWNDWVGCWTLVADANVARLPPAENAAGGVTDPVRRGSGRDASVCVSPSQGGAELRTIVGGQPVLTQTIIADGADHRVNDGGCSGTQRAQWSSDGFRLFTRAQVTCDNQPPRTVTGLALIAPDGQWVDVQAVSIDGRDSVRVRRFQPPAGRARAGVPAAAVRLQIDDVKEASTRVSSRAIEAALIETSARFPLSAKVLRDLDQSGVDDGVIDLMVALSYPRAFAIRPSGPDDRLTPFPPLMGGADYLDAEFEPFFYGPYYSNYYYSPYFYSPFGYSYLRYYPQFYTPGLAILPGDGGGGIGAPGKNLPPEHGRVVNGLGYTRVDRRDAISGDGGGGGGASTRGAGSRGTVSPRGYSGGEAGSSSSSSGGGSSSSGGSSSGSSGASTGGDGGRTAVPR